MNERVNLTEMLCREMPPDELLAGLAEEAAELAQAALKYRRALNKVNPTPVTPEQARADLLTELADVLLYSNLLDLPAGSEWITVNEIMSEKARRFWKRIKEAKSDVV